MTQAAASMDRPKWARAYDDAHDLCDIVREIGIWPDEDTQVTAFMRRSPDEAYVAGGYCVPFDAPVLLGVSVEAPGMPVEYIEAEEFETLAGDAWSRFHDCLTVAAMEE